MPEKISVLVVGGGPVGLTLGLELAWRDVPVLVIDESLTTPQPRANLIAARSLELYRRLGMADAIRAEGLPGDYPQDTAYRTCFIGEELFRVRVPSADAVRAGAVSEQDWPTPEPQHRVNQMFVEKVLAQNVPRFRCLRVERGRRLISLTQDEDQVTAQIEDVKSGSIDTVRADWLIGCDGTRSTVRRQLGLRYSGIDEIQRVRSVYYQSSEMESLDQRPAWMTFTFTPHHVGAFCAIDGKGMWVSHHHFPPAIDPEQFSVDELLARALGRSIDYKLLDVISWRAKAVVTDRYRVDRVFLAGDAAHDWVPIAGFGMNAGIGDAVDLGWKLAAVYKGWGGSVLLDSYEQERRPLGDAVSRALAAVGGSLFGLDQRKHVFDEGEAGAAARAELRELIPATEKGFHHAVGLNFGFQYVDSPVVCPDGSEPTPFSIARYDPDARPGTRLPHLRVRDGVPVFDRLGQDFTIIRVGEDAPAVDALLALAEERRVPMNTLTVDAPGAAELYGRRLVLVRPDQYVAWRGDELPDDLPVMLDRVRGAEGRANCTPGER